jgi:hypothetical protein
MHNLDYFFDPATLPEPLRSGPPPSPQKRAPPPPPPDDQEAKPAPRRPPPPPPSASPPLSSVPPALAAASVVWKWEYDNGRMEPFNATVCGQLEEAFQSHQAFLEFRHIGKGPNTHRVDFDTFTQVSLRDTSKRRQVVRETAST